MLRPGICVAAAMLATPLAGAPTPDFDRDIRPIFSDICFTCHGPDEKQRMAGLRLDTKDGAFAKRGSHEIIVPGDSAKSRLFQRISAKDAASRMPPPMANRTLTPRQIELIREWIDQGAKWETHWAYVPPNRPEPPSVSDPRWPRSAIDNFILARLDREGLKPSPEADKATLLRRVTFDLTGLPPTPEELDSFRADQSPGAYEKRVDKLLASPHYGERMAMQWLDLARYADTHGYHIDSHREMWHWRDWVIDAFNRNLPFDQFTILQLAGDRLPRATLEQRIPTGFNRNHMVNFEGGAIPEEYQNEYVVDRVEATSIVWLGTTMGCARCHDHKYDPIRQKEFYRFYAFFNTVPEKGLDGKTGNAQPVAELASPGQKAELERLCHEITARQDADLAADTLQPEWEKTARIPEDTHDGLLAHYELDGHLADTSGHYRHARVVSGGVTWASSPIHQAAEFDGGTVVDFGAVPDGAFSLTLWLKPSGSHAMPVIRQQGLELAFEEAAPIGDLKRGAPLTARFGSAAPIRTKERLTQGEWSHVALVFDGSPDGSPRVYLDGKPAEMEAADESVGGASQFQGRMADLRIYSRPLTAPEVETIAVHYPARRILTVAAEKRSIAQEKTLREYFLTRAAPEKLRTSHAELKELTKREEQLQKAIPTSMVMAEMDVPRETAVLGRGDYRNRGEKVTPGVPAMLPPLPAGAPANRLTLARWLVDSGNPLTARVTVNRYWQMYFGTGIVKTTEDFGSQGEAPVHPELLDWLATEFVRTGWDIKAMQRLIVTSAAYRQSSRVTRELLEKDPENRLLARGPRFRLPAEVVRDSALAVSGLLDERLGGPSVFPYQPRGLWEETAYGDVFSAQSYTPSHGRDLYRRSMYTFWKRTSPPPSLVTFDAPDREKCTARRLLTNTPLQALVLLNDPTYVEAARVLAQRMMREDAAKRISFAFRLATARAPSPAESKILSDLAERQLAVYRRDPKAAAKLLETGESKYDQKLDKSELAAWTTVASAILNLDETITKE